jgi:hypothetical protein
MTLHNRVKDSLGGYNLVRVAKERTTGTWALPWRMSPSGAGARLAGWDTSSFESHWCPTPGQLRELKATVAGEDLGLHQRAASRVLEVDAGRAPPHDPREIYEPASLF